MHPWTIAIAGAVALSLAGTSPGAARPKLGSTVMPEAAPVFWADAPANLIEYLLFPKGPEERFWRYGYGAIMNAAFADPAPPPAVCRQGRRRHSRRRVVNGRTGLVPVRG